MGLCRPPFSDLPARKIAKPSEAVDKVTSAEYFVHDFAQVMLFVVVDGDEDDAVWRQQVAG